MSSPLLLMLNQEPHVLEITIEKPYGDIVVEDVLSKARESFISYLTNMGRLKLLAIPDLDSVQFVLRYIKQDEYAPLVASLPPPLIDDSTTVTPAVHEAIKWYRTTGYSMPSVSVPEGTRLASLCGPNDTLRVRWYLLIVSSSEPTMDIPPWAIQGPFSSAMTGKWYYVFSVGPLSVDTARETYLDTVQQHINARKDGDPASPNSAGKRLERLDTPMMASTPVSLGIHPKDKYGPHPSIFSDAFARAHNLSFHPSSVNLEEGDPRQSTPEQQFNCRNFTTSTTDTLGKLHPDEYTYARESAKHLRDLAPFLEISLEIDTFDNKNHRSSQLDGTGTVKTPYGADMIVLFVEFKNRDGLGGNAVVQVGLGMQQKLANDPILRMISKMCPLPMVAMTMQGQRVTAWFMYFSDKIYGAEFFDITLSRNSFSDSGIRGRSHAVAFQLLRNVLRELVEFYRNLHAGVRLPVPGIFPNPLSIARQLVPSNGAVFERLWSLGLVLTEYCPRPRSSLRCLFSGFVFRGNKPTNIYVKFVHDDERPYGETAHRLLASHDPPLALELIWVGELVHGWTVVVMETCFGHLASHKNPGDAAIVERDITAALDVLHAEGLVHGDVRSPNIVVSNKRAILLDFDWSGKQGVARYPSVLNHDIWWPGDGDEQGNIENFRHSFIQARDDRARLARTLRELRGEIPVYLPANKRGRGGEGAAKGKKDGQGGGGSNEGGGGSSVGEGDQADDGQGDRPLKKARSDSTVLEGSGGSTSIDVGASGFGYAFEAGFEYYHPKQNVLVNIDENAVVENAVVENLPVKNLAVAESRSSSPLL